MAEKKKVKKVLSTIGTVLLYFFMALCLAAVLITIFSKRSNDGAVSMFGHEMRVVLSGSMEKSDMTDVSGYKIKSIPVKSLIVTKSVPEDEEKAAAWYAELAVGDVLTFRYLVAGKQETITHRIIAIEPFGEGYKFTLRGDNRTENEGEQVIYTDETTNPEPANFIIGKVVFTSVALGNIVYILLRPIGLALVVIVPAAIIMILQVVRIIGVFSAERRKKEAARETEKNNEIEQLKQRLAEMEKRQSVSEGGMPELPPEEKPSDGGMPEVSAEETAQESTPAESGEVRLPEAGEEAQIPAPETQNEGTMPEGAGQDRDPTGLPPAIESSKEVEQ